MKPIIRVSVGHDGAHFAADWDLEKIEVQEILNDGEDIYGPTLQFKAWSFKLSQIFGPTRIQTYFEWSKKFDQCITAHKIYEANLESVEAEEKEETRSLLEIFPSILQPKSRNKTKKLSRRNSRKKLSRRGSKQALMEQILLK